MPKERPDNRLGPPTTRSDSESAAASSGLMVSPEPPATDPKARQVSPDQSPEPVPDPTPAEPVHPPSIHNRGTTAASPDPSDPAAKPDSAQPSGEVDEVAQINAVEPVTEQTPGPGRAGRDLPVAIGVGVGLALAVVLSLIIYRPAFLAILLAAVLISVWELSRALRTVRVRPPRPPLMLGATAMVVVTWLSGPAGLAVTTMLTVLAAIVWRLSDGPVGYFRDASTAVLITVYVPLLACFAVLLLRPDDGVARIVTFILVVVCSDVGGYAAGVLFGKHPLSPSVSPKKSWEGLGGSVLACMVAGLLLVALALDGLWWQGILYGAAIAVTATIGDLGESIIKRDLGIKDMGNLLPGHGGLMDRMDSLLPSAAVAYLLLTAFVPPAIA